MAPAPEVETEEEAAQREVEHEQRMAEDRYRRYLAVRTEREEDVLRSWSDADRDRFADLLTKYAEDFRRYYVGLLGPTSSARRTVDDQSGLGRRIR